MRLRNGTVATVLVFITTFLSLSWYTAWQNGKGKEKAPKPHQLQVAAFLCAAAVPWPSVNCLLTSSATEGTALVRNKHMLISSGKLTLSGPHLKRGKKDKDTLTKTSAALGGMGWSRLRSCGSI